MLRESVEHIIDRAHTRPAWWAEPAPEGDGLFLVRSKDCVMAEGLTRDQAMNIASEYNLARVDAKSLARRRQNERHTA
jgi:hypothetical protein